MKRVQWCESSCVKGVEVMLVRDGFASKDVILGKRESKCLSVKMKCRGVEVRALIDTGCRVNVVFKNAYARMAEVSEEDKFSGSLKGIGKLSIPIFAKFDESVVMAGMRMKDDDFYVIDSINEKYDVLLGFKFLKMNGFVICPEKEMVEVRVGKNERCQLYLEANGDVRAKVLRGIDVFAVEDVKLPRDTKSVVSVKVGWRANLGIGENVLNDLYMVDGSEAGYQVKRVAHVFDGMLDMNDPRVCLQVCTDVKKKRWRGIVAGDRLGVMSTVVNLEDDRYVSRYHVMSGQIQSGDWEYERLVERVKLNESLTEGERQRIYCMLWKRRGALSQGDEDFNTSRLPEFKIVLNDDTPIYQRPRHFPPPVAKEIEEQCEELERVGVIEPSESAWNSPIVPVRKPDGRLRMCIDYRRVNDVTVKDRFPMCVVSECVYSMHGMKMFTKMDLVRGYYQMPVTEDSRPVTAFSTAKKHYQFRNLSFGLANAPAAFQRAMNVVLSGFPSKNVLVFLDDILIMSESFSEHWKMVDDVLKKLEDVGVKVKVSKCEWFAKEVEFLGHKVSESGLRKADKFVKKVREFPKPRTVRELRGFLGLVEFGRKFMKDCSGISKPLTEWTGKKKSTVLKWNERMEKAFVKLREEVVKDVELAYPDYSLNAKMLEVYTDASGYSMGGCLMQDQVVDGVERKRVIAYVSKAFNTAERKYSTIERELAGLRFCLKSLRPFLYGIKFVVKTDHQPLVYLQRMRIVDSRLARTMDDLSDFDYMIEYLPGERNEIADLMSRLPGGENEEVTWSVDPKFLPKGLMIGKECQGGGDSMFESVLYGLRDLVNDGLAVVIPESINELRKVVMKEACKRSEQMGLMNVSKCRKELEAMCSPGVMPFQEILVIVSKVYKVVVCLHYGMEKPIVYRADGVRGYEYVLHLQCLSGVHYNWVVEKKCYDRDCGMIEVCEIEANQGVCEEYGEACLDVPQEVHYCKHGRGCSMTVLVQVNGVRYCGLIDTGAQISLVNASVVRDIEKLSWNIPRNLARVTINGIGEDDVMAWEEVSLELSFGELGNVVHEFAVLSDEQMPHCFLIGIDFVRMKGLSVDAENEVLLKGDKMVARIQNESVYVAGFVGMASMVKSEDELLSLEDVELMQQSCPMIYELRKCVEDRVPVREWKCFMKEFKRYVSRFVVSRGIVYFLYRWMDEEVYVPVFSISGAIGMCKIVHDRYGHMGKSKLWDCMRERLFTPFLMKMCVDVATTCESCQKGKYQRTYASPPILKLSMNEPFEMVVIDCVSLPVTVRGNVGMVVMVDHKSKFAYAVPVRNKTSENVARVVSQNLLPMCVCKPGKMLSDNGPEFVGRPFENMLREWGIDHVRTTPYVPSANGLAERTNRTLIEILRMMTERENEWDLYVGRALSTYNMTVHKGIGMSPCSYVLNFERYIRPRMKLSENDRDVWKRANERFESFEVGQKVLKEVIEKGRLNVNKLREKFEGPYVVRKVWSNGLSYLLEGKNDDGSVKELRAHQSQLRKWREPPRYLVIHPVNEYLGKVAADECEESEPDIWKDKELVIVKRKKKKHVSKGVKSKNECSLEELLDLERMDRTHSVCRFPLTEDESFLVSLNEYRNRAKDRVNESVHEVEEVYEKLEEVVRELSDVILGAKLRELDRQIDESVSMIEDVDIEQEESERVDVYEGPVTRRRGPVPQHEWVLRKAI